MATWIERYNDFHLVTVSCPLCGGGQHRFERKLEGFNLVRCDGCSLVFVNPQLDSEGLMRIYEDKKDPEEVITIYARLATPKVLAEYDHKLTQIEQILGRKGRILDFACAAAYFVERAAARGWDAHGADIGSWARLAAERRGVQNIHIGQLADLQFPDGHFDVVYAAQVFEHLQAPLDVLSVIRRVLKPNGLLYVDVPNYRTIPIMMGKDDFFLNSPPQHINFFTPRTLAHLLKAGGFSFHSVSSEGGLKWENLLGKPIISDIADAYRAHPTGVDTVRRTGLHKLGSYMKAVLRPSVKHVLYDFAKVGINLVAISRPSGEAATPNSAFGSAGRHPDPQ